MLALVSETDGLKIGPNTRAVSKAPAWLARDRQCYDCNQALPLQGAGVALSQGRVRGVRGVRGSQGSAKGLSLDGLQAKKAAPAFLFGVH